MPVARKAPHLSIRSLFILTAMCAVPFGIVEREQYELAMGLSMGLLIFCVGGWCLLLAERRSGFLGVTVFMLLGAILATVGFGLGGMSLLALLAHYLMARLAA